MHRRRLLNLSPLLACATLPQAVASEQAQRGCQHYQRRVERRFDDSVQDAEFAITNHNFRITGRDRIGQAIAERHHEPFPRAEVLLFCNLEYARRLLRADPDLLQYMPCKITLRAAGPQVVIDCWLLPQTQPAALQPAREVNTILRAIVDYAAGDWFTSGNQKP